MGAFAEEATDERKIYEVEEITVTGSRIKSAETLAPAPIVVLSAEEIRAQGLASLGDVLQTLTVQSNAINTQANNGGDGSTRVSLRGLGSNRTLVLVNGRRFVPGGTGANSSVDLNAIPASVIERIEVLKDGASAVYGSDAIGGVVNIITRTAIEGIEIDYYAGTSGAGDGEVMDLSVTTGLQSEKGHIAFSAGYHNQRPVWTGDRSFSESDKAYDWELNDGSYNKNGSSATPEGHIIDRLGEEGNEAWQARRRGGRRRQLGITTAIRILAGVPSTGRGYHRMGAAIRTTTSRKITSTHRRRATAPFSAVLIPSPRMRRRISRWCTPTASPTRS